MDSVVDSPQTGPAYRYEKLTEPDAIRLALLQPSHDLQSPLECDLISTTLSYCQNDLLDHYAALSYVWGDPSRKVTINVAGQTLSITASLDMALRHLRDPSRIRRIWADAICINQTDFEERNQQVSQMASVYAVAQHTIIWLGEGTAETDELFRTLKLLNSQKLIGKPAADSEMNAVSRETQLSASQTILARQWFKRVWALQELVRSRDPWVQCGTSLVRWQDLKSHITESALDIGEAKVQVLDGMAKLHSEHHLKSFRHLSDNDSKDPRLVAGKLLTLLTSRRALGVQDPRDMLFAHVGLLGNVRFDESLLRLIEVDYGKEESLVFFEIAQFLTEGFQDYRILSLLEYRRVSNSNLPSWVPDWTAASPSKFETLSSALKLEDATSATYFPPNPRCINFWVPRSRVLACGGWSLSRIQTLSTEVCQDIVHPRSKLLFDSLKKESLNSRKHHCKAKDLLSLVVIGFKEGYEKWQEVLDGSDTPDPAKVLNAIESQLGAFEEPYDPQSFMRTSRLFDTTADISQAELTLRDGIQCTCDYLTEELLPKKEVTLFGGPQSTNRGTFNFEPQSLLAHFIVQGFGRESKSIFRYRKLATLEDGTPALVPEFAQAGDVVAILMRHAIPLILRPIEVQDSILKEEVRSQISKNGYHFLKKRKIEHFKVIGESFVEGLMYGEAYKVYKADLSRQPRVLALH
jgi:hypothetical protein